jgi:5S rRNA maturation endonuclease (ribonuclease M5)
MVTRRERQHEAFDDLKLLLGETEGVVLVEGIRDVDAIKVLCPTAYVEVFSHVGKTEHDVVDALAAKTRSVLVLTDFDEKGVVIAKRLSQLLEAEGVHVDRETRGRIARLMGVLGVKTIEALDDIDLGRGAGP